MKAISGIGKAVGSLFGAQKMPELKKPEPSFTPPPPEVAAAAARKRLQSRAQAGRAGTIYSQAYSGANLGGTA